MKSLIITKRCNYLPAGQSAKIQARPGQVVVVDEKEAEKMVDGNVAIYVDKPEPKKSPKNKKKDVSKVK